MEKIRNEIIRLSGSGKRVVSTRRHGIYSTMTLPGLDDMPAVRDTLQRFQDFGITDNLSGKTFIDIGANVGAVALEAARRGAKVVGVEYREDRVQLCNEIAEMFKLDATFYQADFNVMPVDRPHWMKKYDIVLSCSVDEYIVDKPSFYKMIHELCDEDGDLYLESNVQRDQPEIMTIMLLESAGFSAQYLGNGHSGGISRKRKLFTGSPK